MNDNYTIFGADQATATRARAGKGFHVSANFKHGNVYLNSDAKKLIFGQFQNGSLLVINSAIENNWYIAKSNEPSKGFECKNNDNEDGSLRVNGAKKVFEKVAQSFKLSGERVVFNISETPIEFQGLKLHKITI